MAKYIKREMVDLNNPGQTRFAYRMKTLPMGSADFIRDCARNTTFSEHEIMGILGLVTDNLARRMARGYSVTIDGLGTFKARVGLTRDARSRQAEEASSPTPDNGEESAPSSLNASSLKPRPLMARAINPGTVEEAKDSTVTDSLAAVPQDSLKALVTITAPDEETQIWLNREPLAYGKWEGKLEIGFYIVSTLKEGLESKPVFLWVDDTLPKVLDLSLPKASYGVLNIHSNVVGATIILNRVEVGVTPCILENLPATVACKIQLKKKGYRDETITVMPVPNDMLNVQLNMKPDN